MIECTAMTRASALALILRKLWVAVEDQSRSFTPTSVAGSTRSSQVLASHSATFDMCPAILRTSHPSDIHAVDFRNLELHHDLSHLRSSINPGHTHRWSWSELIELHFAVHEISFALTTRASHLQHTDFRHEFNHFNQIRGYSVLLHLSHHPSPTV